MHILKDMGCDHIQGYYYARPETAEKVETFFEKEELILKSRFRAASMIVVLLIALSVAYLHTLSYKKACEIYLEETGNIVWSKRSNL